MLTSIKKNDPYAVITVEIAPEDYQIFIKKTAVRMGKKEKIKGFRPGKAPYELLERTFGLNNIFAEAELEIINATFISALKKENISAAGQPEITVEKSSYGQPFIYKIKAVLLPELSLPDISALTIEQKTITVKAEEINQALVHLAKMRSTEALVDRPACGNDLVRLDYNVSIAGVPQEDGQIKNFEIYLGEKHLVPDFEKNIIGLKAEEKKEFDIQFPADYFQKNFAGKKATFTVNVKGVYQITIPNIDDELAQNTIQCPDLETLKNKIKDNLLMQKQLKTEKENEREIIDLLIAQTKFSPLAAELIDNELEVIMRELEHDLNKKKLSLSVWLTNINKNLEQLREDLRPQAEKRVKSALIIRALADQEKINAEQQEIEARIKNIPTNDLADDSQLGSDEFRNYLANIIRGEKTMTWLKEKIIIKKK